MKILILIATVVSLSSASAINAAASDSISELNLWKMKYARSESALEALKDKFVKAKGDAKLRSLRYIDLAATCDGRLTTVTGTPYPTTDQAGISTIFFTPYRGSNIGTYDGTFWNLTPFNSDVSLSLSGLTTGSNYDVYITNNSGTLVLSLSAAWTTAAGRPAQTTQDGIVVSNANKKLRYLGTICATSATTTEDSSANRYVYNYYNRLPHMMKVLEATNSWNYAVDTWRAANNNAANKVQFVLGDVDTMVNARAMLLATGRTGTVTYFTPGIGVDSATVNSAILMGSGTTQNSPVQAWAEYRGYPGVGQHFLQWLEVSDASGGGITAYGDNGDGTRYQSGLVGEIDD